MMSSTENLLMTATVLVLLSSLLRAQILPKGIIIVTCCSYYDLYVELELEWVIHFYRLKNAKSGVETKWFHRIARSANAIAICAESIFPTFNLFASTNHDISQWICISLQSLGPGQNPMHNIYAFRNCDAKRTKINNKRQGLAHILKTCLSVV